MRKTNFSHYQVIIKGRSFGNLFVHFILSSTHSNPNHTRPGSINRHPLEKKFVNPHSKAFNSLHRYCFFLTHKLITFQKKKKNLLHYIQWLVLGISWIWWLASQWWSLARALVAWATLSSHSFVALGQTQPFMSSINFRMDGKLNGLCCSYPDVNKARRPCS